MADTTFTDGSTTIVSSWLNDVNKITYGDKYNNLIINGNFLINQRTYVSGAALAVGAYAHDRWKDSGAGTGTYTFTQTNPSTIVTITNSIAQVVDGNNVIGGVYTLSWTGTATATVNGTAIVSGAQTASLTKGANVTIVFSNGTLSNVKFELGTKGTAFVYRDIQIELSVCHRYFEVGYVQFIGSGYTSGAIIGGTTNFEVTKRVTPTIILGTPIDNNNLGSITNDSPTINGFRLYAPVIVAGTAFYTNTFTSSAEL